jgi:tetratricopeptide (TPR) repeat protein
MTFLSINTLFWERGMLALLGKEEAKGTTREVLAALVASEVVVLQMESRFVGEKQYRFRHALVREGAYAMLTEQDRTLGHQVAGEWLVRAGEQDAMVLAAHFERGGSARRAAEFYARAAEQAHRGADPAAAIVRAEKGLACGPEAEVAVMLNTVLGMAHLLNSRFPQSFEHFMAAVDAAGAESPSLAVSLGFAVCAALFAGRVDAFETLLPRLMQAEPSPGGVASAVQALWAVGSAVVISGKPDDARPFYQRMEGIAATNPGDLLASGHINAFRTNWACGVEHDLWRSRRYALESIAGYEAAGARQYIPFSDVQCLWHTALLGLVDEAILGFDRVLAAPDSGDLASTYASAYKCHALIWKGSSEQARALAEELVQTTAGNPVMNCAARLVIFENLILTNHLDEAEQALIELGDPGSMIPCMHARYLSLQGELRRRQGRLDEALELAAQAIVRSKPGPRFHFSDDPLLVRQAEMLHESGDHESARRVILEARDDLLARAAKIPDLAVRRAFLENIPHNHRTLELVREWS